MSEKLGFVGRKIGMTRIFTEDGVSIPVTVRIRAVFSLASVWPVTSVMSSAQLRTWLSPVWTPIVN